jgi:hypothetical protein
MYFCNIMRRYTWITGSHAPLIPESVAFTLNNLFVTAAVLIFGFAHSSYASGWLLKHPSLYRSVGNLSLVAVRRWTAAAFACSVLSLSLLLVAFSKAPPALHGVLFSFFTLTMVLCCAVVSIDDASASGGNVKLIWMFLGLHLLLPVVLWFDISGSLFMGGPSPAVLGAMRLLFSSHFYVIPTCLILTILLHVFIGHMQKVMRVIVVCRCSAQEPHVLLLMLSAHPWPHATCCRSPNCTQIEAPGSLVHGRGIPQYFFS